MSNKDFRSLQKNVCEEVEELPPLKKLCPRCKPNPNYIEPDWRGMVNVTYYNEKTCEYQVCVDTDMNGDSLLLGVSSNRLPEDANERRQFLRRYIHPAIQIMLEDNGKLVADQIICAYHDGPSLASLSPEDMISATNDIGSIFDLLKDDPLTERCRDITVPANSIPNPLKPEDPIDPVSATAAVIARLPNVKNPYALEIYTYIKDFYIDPYQGLLKVLVAIPQHIFDSVPNAPSAPELEKQASELKEEVILDIDNLFGQVYRFRTAMMVYAKYQSYFYNSQDGDLNMFLNDQKYSDYYASTYADSMKEFYTSLKEVGKINGWNVKSEIKSVIRQNARLIRITFDNSNPEKPYQMIKIEAKKKGCNYVEWTKGLGKKNPQGFFKKFNNDPTTMNYVAKMKEIDIALRARKSYPWLEFLIKFTYPIIKVDYGKINKESVENDAGACVAKTVSDFGLDLKDYILNQTLSIAEILDYEYNKKSCAQLENFENEPEVDEFMTEEFKKDFFAGRKAKQSLTRETPPTKQNGTINYNIIDVQTSISWDNQEQLTEHIKQTKKIARQMNRNRENFQKEYDRLNDEVHSLQRRVDRSNDRNAAQLILELDNKRLDLENMQPEYEQKITLQNNYEDLLKRLEESSVRSITKNASRDHKKAKAQAAKNARKQNHPYSKKARMLALEEFQTQDSILTTIIDFDSWVEQGMSGLKFQDIDTKIDMTDIFKRMSVCNLKSLTIKGVRCLFSGVTQDAALRKILKVAMEEMDIDVFGIFIANLPPESQQKLRQEFEREFGNLPLPWESGYDPGSMDNSNPYLQYIRKSFNDKKPERDAKKEAREERREDRRADRAEKRAARNPEDPMPTDEELEDLPEAPDEPMDFSQDALQAEIDASSEGQGLDLSSIDEDEDTLGDRVGQRAMTPEQRERQNYLQQQALAAEEEFLDALLTRDEAGRDGFQAAAHEEFLRKQQAAKQAANEAEEFVSTMLNEEMQAREEAATAAANAEAEFVEEYLSEEEQKRKQQEAEKTVQDFMAGMDPFVDDSVVQSTITVVSNDEPTLEDIATWQNYVSGSDTKSLVRDQWFQLAKASDFYKFMYDSFTSWATVSGLEFGPDADLATLVREITGGIIDEKRRARGFEDAQRPTIPSLPAAEEEVVETPEDKIDNKNREERQARNKERLDRAAEKTDSAADAIDSVTGKSVSKLSEIWGELTEIQKEQANKNALPSPDPYPSGTYGTALGNIQKLVVDAYIQNIIDILDLDQVMGVLERFPGSELLPRVLNYADCAAQGMFNPPLDSFMQTFALDVCDNKGVSLGVPKLAGKELPDFFDKHFLTKLRNEFIKKVETAWVGVLTRILLKVLQTIDDAVCKGLNTLGTVAANAMGLDNAIGDAFCPDGNAKDIDDTKKNLFKAAGILPRAGTVGANGQPITDDSYDCLFKAINATTSRNEIMGLLTETPGNMDPSILRRIAELTNAVCPEFSDVFGTPKDVADKFGVVANFIPPELRIVLKDQLNTIPDGPVFESICLTQEQKDEWDNNRTTLLTNKGLDQKTAEKMIKDANDRALNDLGSLSDLANQLDKGGADGLLGDALNALLDPTRDPDCQKFQNTVQFETEEMANEKKDDIKNFFDNIERSFIQDIIKRRNSILNNILRDKNNFRLSKHELRTNYPLLWPNYVDSEESWDYRKEFSNKTVTWRMEKDRIRGSFPETVGIWMRDSLKDQNIDYKTSKNSNQIELVFSDHKDDVEYEFSLKYKVFHEKAPKKKVSVDQMFHRKLKKKEAKQLGLDHKELEGNTTVIEDATNVTTTEVVNVSKYDSGYPNDAIPFQYVTFKSLIEKRLGSSIRTESIINVGDSINKKLLDFAKRAFLEDPNGDIPPGFKFGYTDQQPVTFADLHYVNPEADPNDKKTWVYTKMPRDRVLGKSATENPRVHFLDPAIHGGSYVLPKIYVEPATYNGWLGLVKTFVPEIEKCEKIDNGFLNMTEISNRSKKVEDDTPFDERLSLAPDCNVNIPFDKQFAPSTHGLMEGMVIATTRVYVTEYILKTLAIFSSIEFSERNIDSLFTSMLVDEMKKGLMAQTTIWNMIQGYTYYLLFVEQVVQTVQRQIKDGLVEMTPDLDAAFSQIQEAQKNFKAIKIDPKKVIDGTYDYSDIEDVFRGAAIVGFGEFWEDEYKKFEDFSAGETAEGLTKTAVKDAAVGMALAGPLGARVAIASGATSTLRKDPAVSNLAKIARKLGFLTPFKIETCRKVNTIHQNLDAAEVILGAFIKNELVTLMKKINLNLRPRPHVFDIKKYLLSRQGILYGSTLRSGESIVEQASVEGATGFDYGNIFHVVRNPETDNPLSQYEIKIDSLAIPKEYDGAVEFLRDDFPIRDIGNRDAILSFVREKFMNLNPLVSEGFFYLEKYVRVVGVTGDEVVYNIKEFQELLRSLNFDPDSMISDNFGNAAITSETDYTGSIGIKFGVRLIYCPPADFDFDVPSNYRNERTFKLAPVEAKLVFSDAFYKGLDIMPDFIQEKLEGMLEEVTLPMPNASNPIPIAVFEQDILDRKISDINLDDDNFGEDLKCYIDNLVETEDFKLLFEYCFPIKTFCSLFGVYSYYGFFESIGKNEDNKDESDDDPAKLREKWKYRLFRSTKRQLRRTFNSIYRTDDDVKEERKRNDRDKSARFLANIMPQTFLNLDASVKWWQSLRIVDVKPFDADGEECLNAFQKMFK